MLSKFLSQEENVKVGFCRKRNCSMGFVALVFKLNTTDNYMRRTIPKGSLTSYIVLCADFICLKT